MKLKYGLFASILACSALVNAAEKNPVSVHVLNLQTGVPSEGVKVTLEKQNGEKWISLASGVTNADGRISALYPDGQQIQPGNYKVTFNTGDYYAAHSQKTFFPEVPVLFHVEKTGEVYHVPLLLSQYGFSTYRGS